MTQPVGFTEVTELDRAECLQQLGDGLVGRVIYTNAALPTALPVTYLLDEEEVVFRAGAQSRLVAATRNTIVAFEADELDPATLLGWTVLGVGHTYEITDPERLARLVHPMPLSWVASGPAVTIAIRLQQLAGRRLRGPTAPEPG